MNEQTMKKERYLTCFAALPVEAPTVHPCKPFDAQVTEYALRKGAINAARAGNQKDVRNILDRYHTLKLLEIVSESDFERVQGECEALLKAQQQTGV